MHRSDHRLSLNTRHRGAKLTACVSLLCCLTACGQKGPLILPQDQSPETSTLPSKVTTQQKKDERELKKNL